MEDEGEPDGTEFLGEYRHSLDPKGRLILPSVFRDELSEGLVMAYGLDNSLAVYTPAGWVRVRAALRKLRPTDRRERMFARMVTSSAYPETPDKQGRVTIPPRLREYANLVKDVTVVGAGTRIELWDTAAWETYRNYAMGEFADTDQADLGLL